MKVALCLSGRPYGLEKCFPSIYENIIAPNNAEVIFHAWHNKELEGTRYRQHDQFPGLVPIDCERKLLDLYKPKAYIIERQRNFPTEGLNSIFQPDDPTFIFSIQSMLYGIQRAIGLAYWGEYDVICRCRFDLMFHEKIIFKNLDLSKVNLYNDCGHEPGCANDHFAVSSTANMEVYANLYNQILPMYRAGVPFCNEVFLGRWLKANGIKISHIEGMKYNQFK